MLEPHGPQNYRDHQGPLGVPQSNPPTAAPLPPPHLSGSCSRLCPLMGGWRALSCNLCPLPSSHRWAPPGTAHPPPPILQISISTAQTPLSPLQAPHQPRAASTAPAKQHSVQVTSTAALLPPTHTTHCVCSFRIIALLSLEKTFEVTKSNLNPTVLP